MDLGVFIKSISVVTRNAEERVQVKMCLSGVRMNYVSFPGDKTEFGMDINSVGASHLFKIGDSYYEKGFIGNLALL